MFAARGRGPWLFGCKTDLTVFGGSAVLSGLLLLLGAQLGVLHGEAPDWVWLSCVVCVDVAHVWSTLFRVYFDRHALRERPWLYLSVPLLSYGAGVLTIAFSAALFWRALAYVAVFHFVRQQVGFVALYGHRGAPLPSWERALDRATVYAITLHPIVVWHTRLPEPFAWLMPGDFATGLPAVMAQVTEPVMWLLLIIFSARQGTLLFTRESWQPGKVLIVLTTFACWYGGIVLLASDFAFTVTNVLIHGLPYLVLTYRYGRAQRERRSISSLVLRRGIPAFLAVCVGLALLEESAWDYFLWHEHPTWFGSGPELSSATLLWLVPLLALPQLTHYVLDGLVWRVRDEGSVLGRELMKLAIIGDVHHAWNAADTAYFNASDHDAVLFVGDVYNFSIQRGLRAAAELAGLEKPALLIPGNHDAAHPAQLAAEITRRASLIRITSFGHGQRVRDMDEAVGGVHVGGYL